MLGGTCIIDDDDAMVGAGNEELLDAKHKMWYHDIEFRVEMGEMRQTPTVSLILLAEYNLFRRPFRRPLKNPGFTTCYLMVVYEFG